MEKQTQLLLCFLFAVIAADAEDFYFQKIEHFQTQNNSKRLGNVRLHWKVEKFLD